MQFGHPGETEAQELPGVLADPVIDLRGRDALVVGEIGVEGHPVVFLRQVLGAPAPQDAVAVRAHHVMDRGSPELVVGQRTVGLDRVQRAGRRQRHHLDAANEVVLGPGLVELHGGHQLPRRATPALEVSA